MLYAPRADGRSATGFLPENCLQRPTAGGQGRCCQPRVSSAPRCNALEGVQADYRLITQRSSVQIRPPQPNSPQDFKVLGALLFWRSAE